MNFEPAEKMKNFEAGIFQILEIRISGFHLLRHRYFQFCGSRHNSRNFH